MSKIFYKFKNINEYTIDSIKNKYFYFSTPQQLNDPVDCRTPFCYDATNLEILEWIKHAKKMGRLIGENPSTFPFDTVDKVKKSIASTGILKRIFENAENNSANKFHLLSLTDDFNNAKMWNHPDYCNNFSGICIGYLSEQVQQPDFDSYFIKVKGTVSTRTPYFLKYNSDYYFVLKKVEYECWPSEISENEYGPMFLLAYICGNMEKQLITDVYINSQEEGIQFELMKYEQLKKINKNISYKFFEDMLKN